MRITDPQKRTKSAAESSRDVEKARAPMTDFKKRGREVGRHLKRRGEPFAHGERESCGSRAEVVNLRHI